MTMQLIQGGRRFGKTRALIAWASAPAEGEHRIIVVCTRKERDTIRAANPQVEVLTLDDLRRGEVRRRRYRARNIRIGIDDLDAMLPMLMDVPDTIDMATMTDWELDTLQRPLFGPSPAMAAKPIIDADKAADARNREMAGFKDQSCPRCTKMVESIDVTREKAELKDDRPGSPTFGQMIPMPGPRSLHAKPCGCELTPDQANALLAPMRSPSTPATDRRHPGVGEAPPPPPPPPADEDPGKVVGSG